MVAQIDRVEAVACDSEHEAAWLERNLLERHLPRWNRTAGGQEVPVYIRLDTRPRTAGLAVVHSPNLIGGTHIFGPYLGGLRVRTAVAGLHRVMPLAYASDRLTGAERDMARVRGVASHDRAGIVRTLSGVLGRDPAAVAALRSDLASRRDVATYALAFEHAARVHAELHALDWVVSPQRVTVHGAGDVAVAGWADGVLVAFEIRDGRLDGWSQRAATPRSAERRVAATPPEWTAFAQRNAELAARLVRAGRDVTASGPSEA
jgi:excinuclease ABC subunit C